MNPSRDFEISYKNDLTSRLDQTFSQKMMSMREFERSFKDVYTNHAMSQLPVQDGVRKAFASYAGVTERHVGRWMQESSYVRDSIKSRYPSSTVEKPDSPWVNRLNDYRTIVSDYMQQNPLTSYLDNLAHSPQEKAVAKTFMQRFVHESVRHSSAEAKLYSAVDDVLSKNQSFDVSLTEVKKTYLTLVAREAEFNRDKIREIIDKDISDDGVDKLFKRHTGQTVKELEQNYDIPGYYSLENRIADTDVPEEVRASQFSLNK